MARLAFLLLFSALTAGDAAAQNWQAPNDQFRRFGFLTIACVDDGHTDICLGIACPEGQLQLVSAAGGGGPIDGQATMVMGERRASLAFRWDDAGLDALGIAASRAPVSRTTIDAMAAAPRLVLRAGSGENTHVHRFATRNLSREWQRVRTSCPGG